MEMQCTDEWSNHELCRSAPFPKVIWWFSDGCALDLRFHSFHHLHLCPVMSNLYLIYIYIYDSDPRSDPLLKRARVPPTELVLYYCACIRSSLDYACPAFHHALPKYLRDELERVQKSTLACIFPAIHYHDVLSRAEIKSIDEHHEELTNRLFDKILRNPTCKLNQLIPDGVGHIEYDLRCQRTLNVPITKTQRFLNSFIISSSNIYNALV